MRWEEPVPVASQCGGREEEWGTTGGKEKDKTVGRILSVVNRFYGQI